MTVLSCSCCSCCSLALLVVLCGCLAGVNGGLSVGTWGCLSCVALNMYHHNVCFSYTCCSKVLLFFSFLFTVVVCGVLCDLGNRSERLHCLSDPGYFGSLKCS